MAKNDEQKYHAISSAMRILPLYKIRKKGQTERERDRERDRETSTSPVPARWLCPRQ
jgi:hypothetical protein